MQSVDFDVALIGCGVYGHPLAAHAKKLGKQSFVLGGNVQTMFAISGSRWKGSLPMDGNWVKPLPEDTPKDAKKINEGLNYWE
ncbi:MAG: hypothetical protein ACRCV3_00425 [Desulfovibrionaceae bacterium]